jgi:hypothetical protein
MDPRHQAMWCDTYAIFGLLAFSRKPDVKEKMKELGFNP